jgi:GAF domain-containing protein
MLENAVRICDAKFGNLMLREEDGFLIGATYGAHPAYVEYLRSERVFANNTGLKQLVSKKEHYHVLDLASVRTPGDNLREATINLAGARTLIGVPMLKEDEVIGAIIIYRQEVRPFTDKQIELVKNFAAQAVVAIENTRLLNELRQSLEQQTATADVLKVISSSPGDLEPVFQSMLVKAVQICEAKFGVLFRCYHESEFRAVAWVGVTPEYEESLRERQSFRPDAGAPLGRLLLTKDLVHTADELAEKSGSPAAKYGGARSLIAVPMRKQNELVGALVIYRTEVRPFTEKQIELVRNFSAQAVIAIDNARLLTELRESLQQQTATADVLKVISRSTFDLQPVLDTLTESAARLCDADLANIWRPHGSVYRLAASHRSIESKAKDYLENISIEPSRGSCVGRTLLEARTVHIHDIQSDPEYALETSKLKGWRTMLGVPLLREGVPIGVIALVRSTQRPFTTQQIELVTTFADQAVIAIENVRLFDEVQSRTRELSEALKQQTATSEVLQVISSSPGELAPVFEAILGNATRICEANFGTLTQVVDGIPSLMFQRGVPAALEQYWRHETPKPSAHNAISRVIKTGQAVHVTDLQTNEAYIDRDPLAVAGVELGGIRTLLIVPMLKDGKTFGTIGIYRQEVRPFSDKQVELVSSFAAQAAIAIENTRLLKELRQRTDDLSKSLEDLRTAQDRLVQTQKLASLGQLTAGIAHEIKNPLNFVNNFSALSGELIDELQDTLKGISLNDKTRAELAELTNTLRGNLDKVVQHGKRADAIVKNMLLHSREGSGEHRLVDINAIVEESLKLAYHGARAEKQGFNITLERSFDPAAGELDVFPQDITRALLNLISNGFYAAVKRNAEGNGGDREPTLTAATRNLGDRVEIRIRDNGTGISPEVKEKIFNPFFTTKPAGEGTGLGLSISHDIVVKQHGGVIEVDTRPGEFTEIRVILPRVAALLLERS